MSDRKIASVRFLPLASIAGIIAGIGGLGIGIAFPNAIPAELVPDGFRDFFFIIWFLVCAVMIAYCVYNFASFKNNEVANVPLTATSVMEMDEPIAMKFTKRLGKLECLLKDGLVSEEDFHTKRNEIMDEKW